MNDVPTRLNEPGPTSRAKALREYLASADGLAGKAAVFRVLAQSRLAAKRGRISAPVPVAMKNIGGAHVYVRPGTTDLSNASAYIGKSIHRPPPEVVEMRRIVEIGTNIGAGLTALAIENPDAELVGVEPDSDNLEVAHLNLARFGERVRLIQAAIWDQTTDLVVTPMEAAGEHGLTVRSGTEEDPPDLPRMRGVTIDGLLEDAFPGERVDYMHVTIEGSERRVFEAGGDWPERVASLRVELHPYFGYLAGECIEQLERLGYRAYPAPNPPDKWIFAVREQ